MHGDPTRSDINTTISGPGRHGSLVRPTVVGKLFDNNLDSVAVLTKT